MCWKIRYNSRNDTAEIMPGRCRSSIATGQRHVQHSGAPQVDSTPVECARSREAVARSDLAGWAEYGYCASHSRFFWGLRLHLLCTLHGLPVGFALTGAKADERQTLIGIFEADPALTAPTRAGQIVIGDKNYYGRGFEATPAGAGLDLLRPARKGEPPRGGPRSSSHCGRSSNRSTTPFKGQLDLERHGGHTPAGVLVCVVQRSWP
jgi:hypothetical protein